MLGHESFNPARRIRTEPLGTADVLRRQPSREVLATALAAGEFVPWHQPQTEAASGRIVDAEVLVRWQHPQNGLVSPAGFIPGMEVELPRCTYRL